MTEETKVEETKVEEVVLSSTEQRAMAEGWKPKEDYVADGGSESDWRPAKEFVDRGELFTKIEEVKRENRNLKKTMQLFREHHDKVAKVEYQRALETLQRQKKEALIEGNADKVVEIDEQILETRDAQKAAAVTQAFEEETQPQVNPAFTAWVERNNWYQYNSELRSFADQVGTALKTSNPSLTPNEVLREVEKRVKKAYPENFTNPRKEAAPAVEGGGSPRGNKGDMIELTPDEERAMKRFVRAGAMTEEQYKAEVKTMRGMK